MSSQPPRAPSSSILSNLTIGYIARLLLNGTYASLNDYLIDFEDPEGCEALQAIHTLVHHHSHELMVRYSRQADYLRGKSELERTLLGLSEFAKPLDHVLGPTVIEQIRQSIPDLSKEIHSLQDHPPFEFFGKEDAKALALARWFKSDYMKWVDPILCPFCGGKTQGVKGEQPNAQEVEEGAGRVEMHRCQADNCGRVRRFPRYNKVETLLQTREGRCGEWAHLFYAFLSVWGVETRYVWNSEDHVWTEYWSPTLDHWVHVDSCEGETNKPLLYARGWGKKQAFCLAVGEYGLEDVTRAYVDDFDGACQGRRRAYGWSERLIRETLMERTVACRYTRPPKYINRLEVMDRAQLQWIEDEKGRLEEADQAEMRGRTSGPADWRAERQEMGLPVLMRPKYTVKRKLDIPLTDYLMLGRARHRSLKPSTTSTGQPAHSSILLTSGPSQVAGIFLPSALSQQQDFRCQLTFRMTPIPGVAPADGMAIVLCPERTLGLGGYGMGYTNLGGQGDFAIEIDVYRTQDFADDPPTPHISLQSPPDAHHRYSKACTAPSSIPELTDGKPYNLEVYYRAKDRMVTVFLWASERHVDIGLFEAVVPAGNGGLWYLGVTGACGGLWQQQEVLGLSLEEITID